MELLVLTYLLAYCRVTISLAFLTSFLRKLQDVPTFESTIASFAIVPRKASWGLARLFLLGEFMAALLTLVGGGFLWIGLALSLLLLVVFSAALLLALHRNIQVSCNCFGASESSISTYEIWRNGGLILCAVVGLSALLALPGQQERQLDVMAWVLVGLVSAVSLAIIVNLRNIATLLRQG